MQQSFCRCTLSWPFVICRNTRLGRIQTNHQCYQRLEKLRWHAECTHVLSYQSVGMQKGFMCHVCGSTTLGFQFGHAQSVSSQTFSRRLSIIAWCVNKHFECQAGCPKTRSCRLTFIAPNLKHRRLNFSRMRPCLHFISTKSIRDKMHRANRSCLLVCRCKVHPTWWDFSALPMRHNVKLSIHKPTRNLCLCMLLVICVWHSVLDLTI